MKIDPLSKQRLSPTRRGDRAKEPGDGGFAEELSGEIPAGGAPVPVDVMGEALVLFRTQVGQPGLVGRHCPQPSDRVAHL